MLIWYRHLFNDLEPPAHPRWGIPEHHPLDADANRHDASCYFTLAPTSPICNATISIVVNCSIATGISTYRHQHPTRDANKIKGDSEVTPCLGLWIRYSYLTNDSPRWQRPRTLTVMAYSTTIALKLMPTRTLEVVVAASSSPSASSLSHRPWVYTNRDSRGDDNDKSITLG